MKRIVFINSLGHSGSTLLDIMLGCHSSLVGLGEVYNLLRNGIEGSQKTCSCGLLTQECPFWGKVAEAFASTGAPSLEERYGLLRQTFETLYGEGAVPVDSSKTRESLAIWHRDPDCEVKVLYLIKDVRSFTISHLDNAGRKRRNRTKSVPFYRRIPALVFWWWYLENRANIRFLEKERIDFLLFGYEELCLSPDLIIGRICDFLGLEKEPSMLLLKDSRSHVVQGNRMRNQGAKRASISYDNRWLYRNEWIYAAALFPHIMKYNREMVYSNLRAGPWDS